MKILLDECLPRRLLRDLSGYSTTTVPRQGWAGMTDAELLKNAEEEFDVFVTLDSNLVFQQNLRVANLCIIVLRAVNSRYETLQPLISEVLKSLEDAVAPGAIITVAR
jgi:predicted nuclease of predicted toxin-antitoxin system